jgi:hypothetical protein
MTLLALLACAEPDLSEVFNVVTLEATQDAQFAVDTLIGEIDAAQTDIALSVPGMVQTDLSDAIIQAHENGVPVQVNTDIDSVGDAGIAALIDAGVPTTLADGEVAYFEFAFNEDVAWTSDQVIMSHTTLITDFSSVVNASTLSDADGWRLVWTATGENLSEDLNIEHNQIHGGSDASSLTAYSSLAKSLADIRWLYPSDDEINLQVWLGPQERLIKRTIDASWGARANIWVMTNDFFDEGLARALQAKARDGFDVRVVVGPDFGTTADTLSEILLEGGRIDIVQVTDGTVPTTVLVDTIRDRNGNWNSPTAMCLSHDIISAGRFYVNSQRETEATVTDQLVDGNMWMLEQYGEAPSGDLAALNDLFLTLYESGDAL